MGGVLFVGGREDKLSYTDKALGMSCEGARFYLWVLGPILTGDIICRSYTEHDTAYRIETK